MLSAQERAELRALHAKAYSRDATLSLSLEDGARLRELERQRRSARNAARDPSASSGSGHEPVAEPTESVAEPTGSVAEPGPRGPEAPGDAKRRLEGAGGIGAPDGNVGTESVAEAVEAPSGQQLHPARRYWPVLAAAVALLIGLGAGWALWGWNSAESILAIAHSEQRAELENTGDYDPGTVVAISEQHGIVVWRAATEEGEQQCLILTTSTRTQSGCSPTDDASLGGASANMNVPEGDELAGQMFAAWLMPTVTGELVTTVQIWDDSSNGWRSQYTEDELDTIRRIEEAEGVEGDALSILGYDGDTALWSTWGTQGQCVIAEADAGFVQGCMDEMTPDSELVLVADVQGVSTKYIIRNTMRGEQLTVVKIPDSADVEVGAEIDDTTGEFGE